MMMNIVMTMTIIMKRLCCSHKFDDRVSLVLQADISKHVIMEKKLGVI